MPLYFSGFKPRQESRRAGISIPGCLSADWVVGVFGWQDLAATAKDGRDNPIAKIISRHVVVLGTLDLALGHCPAAPIKLRSVA